MSATPENGHLQLGMAIGSILLTSGSFIRRVLYYNVYTILHVIIPKLVYLLYNTLQYFTILYNTIQCTVRIQNTLFISGCSCCSCLLLYTWLTTVYISSFGWFLVKRTLRLPLRLESVHHCSRFGGYCKEFNLSLL